MTGFVEEIARPPGLNGGMFSLSPDAGWLIYSRVEKSESDLMFIDGTPLKRASTKKKKLGYDDRSWPNG